MKYFGKRFWILSKSVRRTSRRQQEFLHRHHRLPRIIFTEIDEEKAREIRMKVIIHLLRSMKTVEGAVSYLGTLNEEDFTDLLDFYPKYKQEQIDQMVAPNIDYLWERECAFRNIMRNNPLPTSKKEEEEKEEEPKNVIVIDDSDDDDDDEVLSEPQENQYDLPFKIDDDGNVTISMVQEGDPYVLSFEKWNQSH